MHHPLRERIRHSLAALVLASAGLAAALVPTATTAHAQVSDGATGYDISWPQCGGAYPAAPYQLAIVGVNGGRPFRNNACLASEFAWAQAASLPPALYLNAQWPSTNTELMQYGGTGPAGTCSGGDAGCLGYNYGWNAVGEALQYAGSNNVDAQVWWLDVENPSAWSPDTAANARMIQGMLDALHASNRTAGVYSTGYQWGQIAGSYQPGVPDWVAGGGGDPASSAYLCDQSHAFTGGPTWLVQYYPASFDGDLACTPQAGYQAQGPYVPLPPHRVLDTRTGSGQPLAGHHLGPDGTVDVPIAGAAGSGVPADAAAVFLNLTGVNGGAATYVTAYPTGAPRALTSNLNLPPQAQLANLVMVPLGLYGDIELYNHTGVTDLVADVEGYVASVTSSSPAGTYTPVTPARIYDSRPGSGVAGAGTSFSSTHHVDEVRVTGQGGVPATGVAAVVLNVTAIHSTVATYYTVWPSDQTQPLASNVNVLPNLDRANRVIVPVSTAVAADGAPAGSVAVFDNAGSADVAVDVVGWVASSTATTTGSLVNGVTPTRLCDTRPGTGTVCSGHPIAAGAPLTLQVAGRAGVPGTAAVPPPVAVLVNLTVVTDANNFGWVAAYPGPTLPPTSDVNVLPNDVVPNLCIVPLAKDGTIRVTVSNGTMDVIVDVLGYYA